MEIGHVMGGLFRGSVRAFGYWAGVAGKATLGEARFTSGGAQMGVAGLGIIAMFGG